jgi:hypothetical protein
VLWAEKALPGKFVLGKEICARGRFFGKFATKHADDKIRKLFPESDKKGNFSRMEYPRIMRNIHPWRKLLKSTVHLVCLFFG